MGLDWDRLMFALPQTLLSSSMNTFYISPYYFPTPYSLKGCSLTSELECKWSRIWATMYVVGANYLLYYFGSLRIKELTGEL